MVGQQQLPNLIVPGVAKAGTSSLFFYLSQHPDICAADRKEINYFLPLRRGDTLAPVQEYARHFAHCAGQPYRLDASVAYFSGGRPLAEAVEDLLTEPRILIMLRDPVARLWSSYLSKKARQKLGPSASFLRFFEDCKSLRASGQDRLPEFNRYHSLSGGYYIEPICDWFDVFGDRVHVVFFEQLAAAPARTVASVCAWLRLSTKPVERFDYQVRNKTIQPRSRAFYRLARNVNRRVDRGLQLNPAMKYVLRSTYAAVNATRQRETLTPRERALVGDFYAPANQALYSELSRRGYTELPAWLAEA